MPLHWIRQTYSLDERSQTISSWNSAPDRPQQAPDWGVEEGRRRLMEVESGWGRRKWSTRRLGSEEEKGWGRKPSIRHIYILQTSVKPILHPQLHLSISVVPFADLITSHFLCRHNANRNSSWSTLFHIPRHCDYRSNPHHDILPHKHFVVVTKGWSQMRKSTFGMDRICGLRYSFSFFTSWESIGVLFKVKSIRPNNLHNINIVGCY